MRHNSSRKSGDQILGMLSVKEAQAFLLDCVNLPWSLERPDSRPALDLWLRRWHKIFTFGFWNKEGNRQTALIPKEQVERFAPKANTALRRIWHEKDARQRDWYFYRLRDDYHRMIMRAEEPHIIDVTDPDARERLSELEALSSARGGTPTQRERFFETWAAGTDYLEEVPKICPFEAAVYWLQLNQKLLLYCEGPVCPAPYFFRTDKGQKYCSAECAHPARREAKLKWWNENRRKSK